MSEHISSIENTKDVDGEFQKIIAASYEGYSETGLKTLGRTAIKKIQPFGADLMMPFTDAHDARAREQIDMVTVSTYHAISGRLHDR